jgi:hypothetical protein
MKSIYAEKTHKFNSREFVIAITIAALAVACFCLFMYLAAEALPPNGY